MKYLKIGKDDDGNVCGLLRTSDGTTFIIGDLVSIGDNHGSIPHGDIMQIRAFDFNKFQHQYMVTCVRKGRNSIQHRMPMDWIEFKVDVPYTEQRSFTRVSVFPREKLEKRINYLKLLLIT